MPPPSVLVVEDERTIAKVLEKRLAALGYVVAGLVSNAADALRLTSEVTMDLVLMDISLGPGMDGISAARLIRAESDLPVVFITAHFDAAILQRAKTSDPFGFIVKPFEDHDLQSAIEIALYRHSVDVRVREKEQWLAATLGSIGDGVMATDREGRVRWLNGLAEALTGHNRAEVLGQDLDSVFGLIDGRTQQRIPNPALQALEQDALVSFKDTTLVGAVGTEPRNIEAAVAPICDSYGHVSGAVVAFRDVTERRRLEKERDVYRRDLEKANDRLKLQATTDPLTQLKNRRVFQDRLWKELSRVRRSGGMLSLLMIDVDRFKQFNDSFGHPAGDGVLKEVARLLEQSARAVDTVARYGGEEFVVLLPDTDEDGARVAAERMRSAVAGGEWRERPITVSIGAATCDANGASDGAGLVAKADRGLYRSKQDGRDRVTHAASLEEAASVSVKSA